MVLKLGISLFVYFLLISNIFGTKLCIIIKNGILKNIYKEHVTIDISDLEKIEYKDDNIQEQIDYLVYMNKFQGFYKGLFDDKFFNKKLLVFFLDYITKDEKTKDCYIDAIDIFYKNNKTLTELSKDNVKEIADTSIFLYLQAARVNYDLTVEGFDDDISSFINNYSDYFDDSKLDIEQGCKLRLIKNAIMKDRYYFSEDFFGLESLGFASRYNLLPYFPGRPFAKNREVKVYFYPYYEENDNNNNIRPIKLTVGNSVYEIKINKYYKVKYFLTKNIFLSFFKDKPDDDIIKIIGNNLKCYEFSDSYTKDKLEENEYIRPRMTVKLSGINYCYFKKNDNAKNLYNKQDNSEIINFSELFKKFTELDRRRKDLDIKYRILSDDENVTNDDPKDKELPYTFFDFEQEIKSAMKPYVYIISKTKTKEDKKPSSIPNENIKMSNITKKNNAFDNNIKEKIFNAKLDLNFEGNNNEVKKEVKKEEENKEEENKKEPKIEENKKEEIKKEEAKKVGLKKVKHKKEKPKIEEIKKEHKTEEKKEVEENKKNDEVKVKDNQIKNTKETVPMPGIKTNKKCCCC